MPGFLALATAGCVGWGLSASAAARNAVDLAPPVAVSGQADETSPLSRCYYTVLPSASCSCWSIQQCAS
jgi:hypothetical protein